MTLIKFDDAAIFKRLLLVLEEKGIDPPKFQKEIGIQSQDWNHWRTRGIPAKWHYTLAKLLNINLEWFIDGEGEKHKKPARHGDPNAMYAMEKDAEYKNNIKNDNASTTTLAQRLNGLFTDNPDKTPTQLSNYLCLPLQSINGWMDGRIKEISGLVAKDVAKFFENINPKWLRIGKGAKYLTNDHVEDDLFYAIFPPTIDENAWKELSPKTRALIEEIVIKASYGSINESDVKFLQDMLDKLSVD